MATGVKNSSAHLASQPSRPKHYCRSLEHYEDLITRQPFKRSQNTKCHCLLFFLLFLIKERLKC